jgi:ATP-dependent exoDNAse (exonuclease V), alpha subunit - helicase superfamily I member
MSVTMDTSIHELLYTALTGAKERLFICYDPLIIKNKEVQASIDFLEECVNHQTIMKEKI